MEVEVTLYYMNKRVCLASSEVMNTVWGWLSNLDFHYTVTLVSVDHLAIIKLSDILEWIDGNKRNTCRTGRRVRCVDCTMGREILPYIGCIGMCHGIAYGLNSVSLLACLSFNRVRGLRKFTEVSPPPTPLYRDTFLTSVTSGPSKKTLNKEIQCQVQE